MIEATMKQIKSFPFWKSVDLVIPVSDMSLSQIKAKYGLTHLYYYRSDMRGYDAYFLWK